MDNLKNNRQNKKRPNERILLTNEIIMTWLDIECLVKTFNRDEDEKIDVDEINELLIEDDKKEPSL